MSKKHSGSQASEDVSHLFAGGGEMGVRIGERDWSRTSLGAPQSWPQSLKTAVRIMLTSRQAMFVWWGSELINLYNDAYKTIIGGKHPQALGQPASQVWHEIWEQVGPRARSAMRENRGTYDEALLLIMERNGYPEETYYTFSYSPVPNDDGSTGGIICANTEETRRIVGERQLSLLRELAATTGDARTFDAACTLSAKCLASNRLDLPFALIYLADEDKRAVRLCGASGIERGHAAAPGRIALSSQIDRAALWPFSKVLASHELCLIDLGQAFGELPKGAWPRSPKQAVAAPILASGERGREGVLIAGLNPFRLFDDDYRGFIDLLAAEIANNIGNAQAYEEERKRAEALAEIDRAKTAFFSNISHEFRTPLTLLLGPTEDALAEENDDAQRQRLEIVQRNALRLQKLVNTLLDFSRLEAGRVQVNYQATDLAALTTDLASVFRSAIDQAGLLLCIDCPTLSQPVFVDPGMWEKIVLNLISNAFKFTLQGQITVALKERDGTAELAVRDTGIGIPRDAIAHLFERFYRVEGAQGRTYEGSGIGLAIVDEMVKLHGGRIAVESTPGQGSAFVVTLPLDAAHMPGRRQQSNEGTTRAALSSSVSVAGQAYADEASHWLPAAAPIGVAEQDADDPPRPPEDRRIATREVAVERRKDPAGPPRRGKARGHRPRLLVADDNADMRHYLGRLLIEHYEVEAVGDGEAALVAARKNMPDLILSDVMMPKVDGFKLLRRLRADKALSAIPVILLSARAGEESRMQGLEAGADDYLVKPFSARELTVRIESCIKLARLRRQAETRVSGILESIADGFMTLDRDWRFIYVNAEAERLCGMARDDLLGKIYWNVFPAVLGTPVESEFRRAVAETVSVEFENYYAPWRRWFGVRGYPSAHGGLSIYFHDITERKRAETWHAGQKRALELLTSDAPLAEVLSALVAAIEEQSGSGLIGSILLLDADGVHLHHGAAPSLPETYTRAIDGIAIGPSAGSCGTAAYSKKPVYVSDIANDPRWADFKKLALAHELRASWSTPIFSSRGEVLGTFSMYHRQPREPDADDLRLVELAARSASIAIERRQAEAALRRSESNLADFFDNAAIGLHWVGPDGIILRANQAELDLLGYSRDEYIGRHIAEFHADVDTVEEMMPRLTAAETLSNYEARLRHKDGSIRHVLISSNVLWEDGRFVHTRCFTRDITDRVLADFDRQRAEEALRQNRARLTLALYAGRAGAFEWDIQRNVRIWSPELEQLYGVAAGTFEGNHEAWVKRVVPEDVVAVEAGVRAAWAERRDEHSYEFRIVLPDRSERWLAGRAHIEYGADGQPLRMTGINMDISERKKTERALLENEERFRVLFDSGPVAIFSCDKNGVLQNYNRRAAELWGREPECGDPNQRFCGSLRLYRPDGSPLPHAESPIVSTLQSGEAVRDVEVFIERPDGSRVAVVVTFSPLKDERGETIGAITAFYDITERKAAEEALRESELRYRLVADASHDAVWDWNLVTDEVIWNEGVQSLFGYAPGDVGPDAAWWCAHIHPEDRERVVHGLHSVIDGGGCDWADEYRFLRERGDAVLVYDRGRVVRDGTGKPVRMVGAMLDLSERKKAEAKLRESEETFRTLADSMSQLAWMTRADGHIFWYNRRWYDYTGTTLEQMEGWGWQKVHHPDHVRRVVEKISRSFATGEVWEDLFPLRGADGNYRWFLSRAVPIRDRQGQVLRWFGTNTDVTEQRNAEERLRDSERRYREVSEQLVRLNEGLERRVNDRTAVAERRATQLRSLATQLTQAETRERRRIAQLLHDNLQQLLLSIKFKLGVLKNRAPDLDFAPAFEIIDQSIQASRALTADLSPPILYQLNLTAALEWLAPRLLAQQGLHVQVITKGDEPPLSDETKALLYQAVSELLLNIVKHARTERARIRLMPRWRGAWLIVRVDDEGAGFDTRKLGSAEGFGLFGIQERLEFFGGRTVVRSRPGRGTSVALIVPTPLANVETAVSRAPRPIGTVQRLSRAASAISRVMLVDDHAMVRDGLRGILEGEPDLEVVGEADNGIRAVEMASELQPDIVLMDINMPGMDGIEATRRIKAALPQIRIIGLSMHADDGVRLAMVAAGASDYVTKDVISEKLCAVIRQTPEKAASARKRDR